MLTATATAAATAAATATAITNPHSGRPPLLALQTVEEPYVVVLPARRRVTRYHVSHRCPGPLRWPKTSPGDENTTDSALVHIMRAAR